MKRVAKTQGFTLVELIMTIIIIGVLAVAVAPRFFSLDTYQERFYTEDLLAALRYARRSAEASNCPVRVRLLTNGFDLTQDVNCFTAAVASYTQVLVRPSDPDLAYVSTEKPSSLNQNATLSTFFFQPNGKVVDSSANLSNIILTLTGSGVITTFKLDGGSGYVSKL